MKVHLIIEDTPRGVTVDGKTYFSGCNDSSEQSLAFLLAVNLQKQVEKMQKTQCIRIDDEPAATH